MRTLLINILIFAGYGIYAQEIKIGDDASDYKLKIILENGKIEEKPVSSFNDEILILHWWDLYCSGSKELLKNYNNFYKIYSDKISFYAVSDDYLKSILKYKDKMNYSFSFCSDESKLKNKFFPYTASTHMAIIDRNGKCIYHGSVNLSNELLDSLVLKGRLPVQLEKEAKENYEQKQFMDNFEEFKNDYTKYYQTGFKIEPYNSKIKYNWNKSDGKYFYGYNMPIYEIYKNGLNFKDSSIIISNTLKQALSATDTTNTYNIGYNYRKTDRGTLHRYKKEFKNYLDSAFSLTTEFNKNGTLEFEDNIQPKVNIFKTKSKKDIFNIGFKLEKNNQNLKFSNELIGKIKTRRYSGGITSQFLINEHSEIQPEILYQTIFDKTENMNFKMQSIILPVNYYLTTSRKKPIGLFLNVGGSYSYNFQGEIKSNDIDSDINKFSWGLNYGAGLRIGGHYGDIKVLLGKKYDFDIFQHIQENINNNMLIISWTKYL